MARLEVCTLNAPASFDASRRSSGAPSEHEQGELARDMKMARPIGQSPNLSKNRVRCSNEARMAHLDRVSSGELFDTLADWDAYLKAEKIKFPGPKP